MHQHINQPKIRLNPQQFGNLIANPLNNPQPGQFYNQITSATHDILRDDSTIYGPINIVDYILKIVAQAFPGNPHNSPYLRQNMPFWNRVFSNEVQKSGGTVEQTKEFSVIMTYTAATLGYDRLSDDDLHDLDVIAQKRGISWDNDEIEQTLRDVRTNASSTTKDS